MCVCARVDMLGFMSLLVRYRAIIPLVPFQTRLARCRYPVPRAAVQMLSQNPRSTWAPPVRCQWEESPRRSGEEPESLQK